VIKIRRRPCDRRVAGLACLRKAKLHVVGIVSALEIVEVTSHTCGLLQVVIVIDVAISTLARRHGVCAGQWESGRRMVKTRVEPGVGSVAGFASGREFPGHVVGVFRGSVVGLVTTEAGRRHGAELADCAALVAGIAGYSGMGSSEREAIQMLVDLRYIDFPSADGVATLASGAHLAAMDIRVAICAFRADIAEYHLGVTPGAGHALVHTAQRKLRQVVIKFRNGADRLPSIDGMAVLTGQVEIAVWTAGILGGRRLSN